MIRFIIQHEMYQNCGFNKNSTIKISVFLCVAKAAATLRLLITDNSGSHLFTGSLYV
jgi:hypothetical protein